MKNLLKLFILLSFITVIYHECKWTPSYELEPLQVDSGERNMFGLHNWKTFTPVSTSKDKRFITVHHLDYLALQELNKLNIGKKVNVVRHYADCSMPGCPGGNITDKEWAEFVSQAKVKNPIASYQGPRCKLFIPKPSKKKK